MTPSQPTITSYLNKSESELEKIFVGKVPALPENVKDILVKVAPYLALFSMLMLAPLILAAFGLGAAFLPFSYLGGLHMGFSYTLGLVFSLGQLLLELLAIPGLFKRQVKAWQLMFYSSLIYLVGQLVSFNLGSVVIGGAISFYFLFQVKSKYTK
ncbi:MAG: hypothetical protein UX62_C0005G0009 [Microgenomates group bacterium GW2011_GWA2_46_7]|nr:MAG: hypothetical protein UX62_C0005G0009 [Microgenomates group bacterium GW2011_GWA2_46_7]